MMGNNIKTTIEVHTLKPQHAGFNSIGHIPRNGINRKHGNSNSQFLKNICTFLSFHLFKFYFIY